jgi:hypothetical protein
MADIFLYIYQIVSGYQFRRRGLKIPRRKACRFESGPGTSFLKRITTRDSFPPLFQCTRICRCLRFFTPESPDLAVHRSPLVHSRARRMLTFPLPTQRSSAAGSGDDDNTANDGDDGNLRESASSRSFHQRRYILSHPEVDLFPAEDNR